MRYSYPKIIIHSIAIAVFLSIPIFSSPDFGEFQMMLSLNPFQRSFLGYLFLVAFFYANYYLLIPKFYFKKKYILFYALVIICYLLITYLPSILISENIYSGPTPDPFGNKRPIPPLQGIETEFYFLHTKSLLQFSAVLFLTILLRINKQLQSAEKEKLKAEVSYLKAQINPHFLFNTLNSLYALTIQKSDSAPDAVIRLSNMMRYVVTESTNDLVLLEKEINYIKDYIAMQRLRLSDETKFNFNITGDPSGKSIAPLVFIPFIENAFKYGINPEENWHISIKIDITGNTFILEVKNNKVNISFPKDYISEKGIENTRQRLNFIYPRNHNLEITENDQTFVVFLKINLV